MNNNDHWQLLLQAYCKSDMCLQSHVLMVTANNLP